MKVLLVGFKLTIGNELYMNILYNSLKKNDIDVDICGDRNYIKKYNVGFPIASGGDVKQMIFDTLNIKNWFRFYKLLKNNNYDIIFIISSHTLNNIALLIAKIFKIKTISHIHDPLPHSGSSYGWIIYISQKLQSKIANGVIVYGEKLKEIIHKKYSINNNKIFLITHGVYRDNINKYKYKTKKYISLLGRIDNYKGIDIFLEAIKELDKKIDKNIKFVIGGKGDLSPYKNLIEDVKDRVIIKNYLIPNEEFDEILEHSYALVLPYKDGTQTGNIQVAYYCGTPVIVTNVGSIPELVEESITGFVIEPNNPHILSETILKLLNSDYKQMGKNAFEFYKNNLRWDFIIKYLIEFFK